MPVLSWLYSVSGFVMVAFYWPQIRTVLRARSRLEDVSIATWGTWTLCTFVSFLYAAFDVRDLKFALFSALNSLACGLVTAVTAVKRRRPVNIPGTSGS